MSSPNAPSKPVNITSPRIPQRDVPEGLSRNNSFLTPSGTPDLRALRAQYTGATPPPNIPPRTSTPGSTPQGISPSLLPHSSSSPFPSRMPVGGIAARKPSGIPGGTGESPAKLDDLPDEEKAKVVRRHLVSKEERRNGEGASPNESGPEDGPSRRSSNSALKHSVAREDTEPFPVPYHAPGADVTHDIYKWQSEQRRQAAHPRRASFSGSQPTARHPAFEHIHEPGGFRRNYVLLQTDNQEAPPRHILGSFIDFLLIFGHFAGEDLEEDEGDDKEDEEAEAADGADAEARAGDEERRPLLERSRSRSRRRRLSVGPHGDATVLQAVLMLMKGFVGTGILFLGKAFYNGGIIFSSAMLVFIGLISLYSFLLLLKAKFVVSGSFGDIGGALYGPWMRYAILSSIVISQLGFVAAYTIFVAENLQAFVMAVTNCLRLIPVQYFILMQLVIFLPMVLIRNLAKLSTAALIADVFILAGLVYIFSSEFDVIAKNGIADVKFFNPNDFPLLIGTAVFSFEGIGLVIPITDSMREPHKFPKVLTVCMIFLTALFGGAGALAYLTFGSDIQTVVIVNLDSESKLVQVVQFLYSIAILLSVPLQLFPAVRIMENGLFTRSGKADVKVKWLKNIFRFFVVMLCTVISFLGAKDLDKFVAFIGSFACVPLCYVYPAMLHYKACAHTRRQKAADIALMVFGFAAAVYTTVQTLRLMFEPGGAPKLGKCDIP